jgi:hypothetical protein
VGGKGEKMKTKMVTRALLFIDRKVRGTSRDINVTRFKDDGKAGQELEGDFLVLEEGKWVPRHLKLTYEVIELSMPEFINKAPPNLRPADRSMLKSEKPEEKFSEKQEEKLAEQLDKMPGDTAEEKIRKSITDVQPLWGEMPCPGRDGKLGHCIEHEFCCYCQTDSLSPPCIEAEDRQEWLEALKKVGVTNDE